MIAVKIADPGELDALMSKDDYYKMIKEME
jgi:hypothetical protein